jgi:5-formyltetrahydrofolate cyclo-ligase
MLRSEVPDSLKKSSVFRFYPCASASLRKREVKPRLKSGFFLFRNHVSPFMFFASFRTEVETGAMIRRVLSSGKRVVLPKVQGKELALYEIHDFDHDVVPGAWGIPEPKAAKPARLEDIDLMIMPGAAFDASGNRVGYGAGFYDKLLPAFKNMTIALAFEAQIVQAVPSDPHDVPVNKIVTEKRIIEVKS